MSDDDALPQAAAEFNKLYETGEFQLGYCLAEVQINEKGTVDAVRVRRPQNVDKRVASASHSRRLLEHRTTNTART